MTSIFFYKQTILRKQAPISRNKSDFESDDTRIFK